MITADMDVCHPLYPELGIGKVLYVTASSAPAARVNWVDAGQISNHSVSVLRAPGARGCDAREAIAKVAGLCSYVARHAAPHDHTQCLLDADELIASLALAGYRVIGITELDNLQES
jgi:hypothetical protein